jgi:alpha-L-fucosidase
VTAYRAQRLYTDRRWPNALVLKITNVDPAMTPPEVLTGDADWNSATATAVLHAKLENLGNVAAVDAGFQYRLKKDGTDLSERIEPWIDLPLSPKNSAGEFTYSLSGLAANRTYEFRARVNHPLLTIYGQEKSFRAGR